MATYTIYINAFKLLHYFMEISILSEAFSKNDVNSIVYIIVKPEELLVELWNEIRGRLQKIGFSKGKQCFF